MLCQKCGQRPAVIQRSVIRNNEKIEEYLCEECARQVMKIPLSMEWPGDFDQLFANLLNLHPQEQQVSLSCPKCGLRYQEFLENGRFGCATCYEAFADKLDALFNKLHNANCYQGKIPGKPPVKAAGKVSAAAPKDKLSELTLALRQAVEQEEYEKAAQLRDQIKALEEKRSKQDGGGKGGSR